MKVYFRNSYFTTVWVAVMYYNPGTCQGAGEWETAGWWKVTPGNQVWAISTNNRYAAFYAEADNGAFWSGIYGPMWVYQQAFRICLGRSMPNPIGRVGLRLIDTQGRDTIVNFVPAVGQIIQALDSEQLSEASASSRP